MVVRSELYGNLSIAFFLVRYLSAFCRRHSHSVLFCRVPSLELASGAILQRMQAVTARIDKSGDGGNRQKQRCERGGAAATNAAADSWLGFSPLPLSTRARLFSCSSLARCPLIDGGNFCRHACLIHYSRNIKKSETGDCAARGPYL